MQLVTLKEAKVLGLTRYYTGILCKYGHDSDRMVSNRRCVECLQQYDRTNQRRIEQNRVRALKQHYDNYGSDPEYTQTKIKVAAEWNKDNLERRREIAKLSARKNRERQNAYDNARYHTNIQDKIRKRLRRRLGDALRVSLRGGKRAGSAVRDLGCSLEEFKIHIEKQFTLGMSWENWGIYGWHLDHRIPLSQFDLTDRDQFLKACHYTNYQPLWAVDNLSKNWRTN